MQNSKVFVLNLLEDVSLLQGRLPLALGRGTPVANHVDHVGDVPRRLLAPRIVTCLMVFMRPAKCLPKVCLPSQSCGCGRTSCRGHASPQLVRDVQGLSRAHGLVLGLKGLQLCLAGGEGAFQLVQEDLRK